LLLAMIWPEGVIWPDLNACKVIKLTAAVVAVSKSKYEVRVKPMLYFSYMRCKHKAPQEKPIRIILTEDLDAGSE
jgi:hypothetical protein